MAKKLSASSRPEKPVRVKAERIFNKPLTKQQRAVLDQLAKKADSEIDFSDIPPLTDEQLAELVPFRLRSKTTLISFRVQKSPERRSHLAEINGPRSSQPDQRDPGKRDGR